MVAASTSMREPETTTGPSNVTVPATAVVDPTVAGIQMPSTRSRTR
jgi:hypothetical protein